MNPTDLLALEALLSALFLVWLSFMFGRWTEFNRAEAAFAKYLFDLPHDTTAGEMLLAMSPDK